MGFYNDIRNTHGVAAMKHFKRWARANSRLASLHNRRIFLLRCRSVGVKPKHLINNIKGIYQLLTDSTGSIRNKIHNFNIRLENNLLNFEVSITIENIVKIEKEISSIKDILLPIVGELVVLNFQSKMKVSYNRKYHLVKEVNIRKFTKLEREQSHPMKVPDKWLKNISGIAVPNDILTLLSLGPKFNITPTIKDINLPSLLADIDNIVSLTPHTTRNILTARAVNVVTNYVHTRHNTPNLFNRILNKTRSFFKNHEDLLITRSDKGNVTVLMKKEDYQNLAKELLTDEVHYKRIPRDPTNTIQQKANKLMTNLKKTIQDDSGMIKKHTIYNSKIPKFYGLPKIHKPQLSLRPIISSIDCPTIRITQYTTDLLTASYNRHNNYYVQDSFSFSEFINNFEYPPGYVLVSLDAISLFTNITAELAIQCIKKHWNEISPHTKIPKKQFTDLVLFIFDNTYFTFENKFYKQIIGTPMGAKLPPILAQYVMDDLLDIQIPKLPFRVPFLKKYVDDIVCMIPEGSLNTVLNIFNSYNTYIQFTAEEEHENSLPFLDMKIKRTDGKLITEWYRKPNSSGRYLHYMSSHPYNMKINLIIGLKDRITKLTHPTHLTESIQDLRNLLLANGYPSRLLNKILYNMAPSPQITNPTTRVIPEQELVNTAYATLPYLPGLSNKISLLFQDHKNIKIIKTMKHTLNTLVFSRLKDKEKKEYQSKVVYSIPCRNCEKTYIGQTSNWIQTRITSHKSDTRRNMKNCSLAIHCNTNDHIMNYSDTKILHRESNYNKRLFLEMMSINATENTINSKQDTNHLNNIYCYLIELSKMKHATNTTHTIEREPYIE